MTAWATALGATMGVALLASFPVAFAVLPESPDLRIELPSARPFEMRADSLAPLPRVRVEPSPVPDGLMVTDTTTGPGLDLRTWGVTYSSRWEREVTLPILTGPVVKEGDEVCGIGITIGAGLFDTSRAGAGLQAMLERKVSESLPYTYTHPQYRQISVTFPKPQSLAVQIALVPGRLAFLIKLVLEDGTQLDAFFAAQLVEKNGAPALLRIGPLVHNWRGPTYDDLLRQAAAVGADEGEAQHPILALFGDYVRSEGARQGVERAQREGHEQAGRKLTDLVDSALATMSLGLAELRGPHHPLASNRSASVRLRLAATPTVSPKGIVLRVCASTEIGKKVDPLVTGSVGAGAMPPMTMVPAGDASIEVAADGDTLNHLLYFAWQSGALREVGTSKALVRAALDRTRDRDGEESALQKLAFEFKGFDPGLPPTIIPASSSAAALGFVLGDVKIGDWNERGVVAHAAGTLSIEARGGILMFSAAVSHIFANCTGPGDGGSTALTPCVSDLLPTVRDGLIGSPVSTHVKGADVLAKLPNMGFAGGEVQLSDLHVEMAGAPIRMNLRVQARILGSKP